MIDSGGFVNTGGLNKDLIPSDGQQKQSDRLHNIEY